MGAFSERILKETSTQIAQEDHSEKAETVQEDHSARTLREEASAEESRQEEASIPQRRASTRRISTISVMRTRAESIR